MEFVGIKSEMNNLSRSLGKLEAEILANSKRLDDEVSRRSERFSSQGREIFNISREIAVLKENIKHIENAKA